MARIHLAKKWDGGPGAPASWDNQVAQSEGRLVYSHQLDAWSVLKDFKTGLFQRHDADRVLLKDVERQGARWAGSPETPRRRWGVSTAPTSTLAKESSMTPSAASSFATTCPSARPLSAMSLGKFSARPTHRKFKVWGGTTPETSAVTPTSAREALDARKAAHAAASRPQSRAGRAASLGYFARGGDGAVSPALRLGSAGTPSRPATADDAETRIVQSPIQRASGGGDPRWISSLDLPTRQKVIEPPIWTERNTPSPLGVRGEVGVEEQFEEEHIIDPDTVPPYSMQRQTIRSDTKCQPAYDLWVSLQGGNGKVEQKKAFRVWEQQMLDHEEAKKAYNEEQLRQRRAREEAIRRKKEEEAALHRRVEEAEREALRRKEEERLRREREAEEERQRRLEEERRRELLKPRDCKACSGTGRCANCNGTGCTLVTHLTSVTHGTDDMVPVHLRGCEPLRRGRLPIGCLVCGGCGEDASFEEGDGICRTCTGRGKIDAPPGGWPA